MAKLCVHGQTVGTIAFLTYSKRFMSDGVILRNAGQGWKLQAKVKAGVTPQEAFASAVAHQAANRAKRPAYDRYAKLLHDTAPLATRWKLHAAVQMMPNDPDGVWSECCDGYGENVHADVDDVVELCRAYQAAVREAEAERATLDSSAVREG